MSEQRPTCRGRGELPDLKTRGLPDCSSADRTTAGGEGTRRRTPSTAPPHARTSPRSAPTAAERRRKVIARDDPMTFHDPPDIRV